MIRGTTWALTLALVVAVASPVAAQTPIGVIIGNDNTFSRAVTQAFEAELKRAGVTPQLLTQRPNPDTLAWANTVRKFAAFDVELLFVIGTPVGLDALVGEIDVPVIFAAPKHEAPAKASANVTGVTWHVPLASVMKYLESIKKFSTLGIAAAKSGPLTKRTTLELDRLSGTFGYKTVSLTVTSAAQAKALKGAEAVFVSESCARSSCIGHIVATTREAGIPTASTTPGAEDAGILLTLEADPRGLGVAAARLAAQALKGKSPGSMPLVTAKKIAMVINMKEAAAMGIKVPFDVLSAAARVIK